MRKTAAGAVFAALTLSACATDTTPVCRAPHAYEMQAFSAVISHNPEFVAQTMAPGAVRDALLAGDPTLRSHIWGSQGETRGTVIGLLAPPPLCVLDDPSFEATDASRQILVYPQDSYNAVSPAPDASVAPPFPFGVHRRDYMTCRFEQTASGWKLADMCGYRMPVTPAVTG